LLGSESNDIDVALSDIMGLTFAEHLAEFARTQDVETGTLSKIALNPDQSKHLETARLKLFGLELDFVTLRSEEYAANSRIPTGVVRPASVLISNDSVFSQDLWNSLARRSKT